MYFFNVILVQKCWFIIDIVSKIDLIESIIVSVYTNVCNIFIFIQSVHEIVCTNN